ncbi:MAG TPA: helix-turn-helix domain-containing protein [Dermatophilaceae bacterium]|jgi:hypothetical protein|uniref:Helix-turn-helix domain-containing protein n=1 Tax=Candidatus Phosphoribacter hodrii TaxID=2953743 RepID=A0A934X885_9MICO|nr:helix-turn-helix domain-containing protein [Candidatus Phosphoribacter hodrii]MBP8837855.1 helix-turn-helix domain-containing protein [Dermatophilaceae bacterium]MBL0003363.1 helix-turn-helix domain-containing protein [Candidatus Phosphoribacter hodrii]HNV14679.1 helix-turn-helix domain-containing protein [Dermatophilaceae bacterium]HOA02135.1 helix-turn-helix domain-containing protein [Dermatophilaceae bacterium]
MSVTPRAPRTPRTPPSAVPAVTSLALEQDVFERLRGVVPRVAAEAVETIMREVPSYARPFSDAMGARIRTAVELALVNFLELARVGSGTDPAEPIAPSTAAAYELGRGEARSGRSMDALQAAYRVGARVCWRGLSREAVATGVPAATLGAFAELVFAYIDALSSASISGHADELATAGRARERYRDRLAALLVGGGEEADLVAAARRADWHPPRSLTAVLLPEGQLRAVLGLLDARTLAMSTEPAGVDDEDAGVLLVPDATGRDRERLVRQLEGRGAIIGPERPWLQVHRSFQRVLRAREFLPQPNSRGTLDTDDLLAELLLSADPEALADLRARALAPLAAVRPTVRLRLEETLRSWLLHHGRRELIAAHLFVHPQTVRYRMAQLRELFGDRLDDPEEVLRLTMALALQPTRPPTP